MRLWTVVHRPPADVAAAGVAAAVSVFGVAFVVAAVVGPVEFETDVVVAVVEGWVGVKFVRASLQVQEQ